jgi:hypothetical protein
MAAAMFFFGGYKPVYQRGLGVFSKFTNLTFKDI